MLFLQCMFFLIIIEVKSNSVYLLVPIVLMQVRILIHAAAELIYEQLIVRALSTPSAVRVGVHRPVDMRSLQRGSDHGTTAQSAWRVPSL